MQKIDKEKSSIYVIDNGVGMTDNIIANQWMTIGTDDKLYSHTSDGGRVKTGAKGIGRFALNRLGSKTELYTISEETNNDKEVGEIIKIIQNGYFIKDRLLRPASVVIAKKKENKKK